MRLGLRLASASVIGLALAACGLLPTGQPGWVANRTPLDSCGEERQVRGDTDVEARQCLLDAFEAGQAAELISTEAITEGREVTRYIRVHEDGTIEMLTDMTRDSLGPGGWKRETCGQLLSAEEVRDVWIEEVFVILDCQDQPLP